MILDGIERNKGCYAKSLIIREMGMPIGVCEDIIDVRVCEGVEG